MDLRKGQLVRIFNAPLYYTKDAKNPMVYRSGKFFVWGPDVKNGRVIISAKEADCGATPVFNHSVGWVDVSEIVFADPDTSGAASSSKIEIYSSNDETLPTTVNKAYARRTAVYLTASGANITSDIKNRFISMTYTAGGPGQQDSGRVAGKRDHGPPVSEPEKAGKDHLESDDHAAELEGGREGAHAVLREF